MNEGDRSQPKNLPTINTARGRIEVGENEGKIGKKMSVNFDCNLPRNYLIKICHGYIRLKKKII